MANVNDKVTQIRQAVLGKDVRENIASGIEVINEEVINTTARQDAVDINEQSRIAAEDIRQSREDYRQNTFETNEADRQSEFDANETDRINNYNTNEAIRDTNEVTRQTTFTTNEATRQSAFDTAETNRADQYNTNEAARDANEVARQSEFDTNENTRTNQYNTNEATRNTNEINRQSTFDTNETNRTNTFNTNEQARIDAENIRETNETNRVDSFASMESRFDAMEHLDAGFEIVEARGTKASINERFVDIEDDIVNINTTVGNQVSFVSTPEGEPEPVQEITEYNFIDHIADLETEVQGARNGEINLNDRLDGFDTSLLDRVKGVNKIYTSANINELGLTFPVTCQQLAEAMADGDIISCDSYIISDAPTTYGSVFVRRANSNRINFEYRNTLNNDATANNLYIGAYRGLSTPKFSGWMQVSTKDILPNPNVIVNGDFRINQRTVSGTVTLSANVYGHDRWKAGASGCTYTFATSGGVTTITITAGSLIQVIDGTNLQSGTYALSWGGTATGKIGSGSYSASGITGSVTGGSNLSIEFNTGTLSNVKLEKGSVATPFVQRLYTEELLYCQRYYQKATVPNQVIHADSAQASIFIPLKVTMRTTPSIMNTPSIYLHKYGATATVLDYGSNITGIAVYNENIMLESTLSTIEQTLYAVNQSSSTNNYSSGLGVILFDAEIY